MQQLPLQSVACRQAFRIVVPSVRHVGLPQVSSLRPFQGKVVEEVQEELHPQEEQVVGLSNERIPKRLIFALPNGKRPKGRPK
ncbi:unnamed protein product [Nezara viridula]|uniref:Uncharacterized protein n=1 Tax=Nezara viridula TaxID=85310 RepID=A0A9P0MRJ2_NEZVI|nr:unnamed protein product [Nezara viridula]